jgi:FkbM family methyltransferase
MLINLHQAIRRHRMKITGIIHVGAHFGEEYPDYIKAGIKNVSFIEPCQPAFEILSDKFKDKKGVYLYNCACGSVKGKASMNIETRNNGQSNSLLAPVRHLEHYPEIQFQESVEVDVIPLDELEFYHEFNLLMMDVQGYELEVLKGGRELLKDIRYVYSEVNTEELYQGCAKLNELESFLSPYGFHRVALNMTKQGWGDALFIKR